MRPRPVTRVARHTPSRKKGLVGGIVYRAGKVKTIRQSKENALLVRTGDTFSDNLLMNITKGEAMITMMDRLGYDFKSFGNHEIHPR